MLMTCWLSLVWIRRFASVICFPTHASVSRPYRLFTIFALILLSMKGLSISLKNTTILGPISKVLTAT